MSDYKTVSDEGVFSRRVLEHYSDYPHSAVIDRVRDAELTIGDLLSLARGNVDARKRVVFYLGRRLNVNTDPYVAALVRQHENAIGHGPVRIGVHDIAKAIRQSILDEAEERLKIEPVRDVLSWTATQIASVPVYMGLTR